MSESSLIVSGTEVKEQTVFYTYIIDSSESSSSKILPSDDAVISESNRVVGELVKFISRLSLLLYDIVTWSLETPLNQILRASAITFAQFCKQFLLLL